jgi:hypothetical protein
MTPEEGEQKCAIVRRKEVERTLNIDPRHRSIERATRRIQKEETDKSPFLNDPQTHLRQRAIAKNAVGECAKPIQAFGERSSVRCQARLCAFQSHG